LINMMRINKNKIFPISGIAFFLFVFVVAAKPSHASEIILNYVLTENRAPIDQPGKKKSKPEKITSKKDVVFGDGFFSVKEKSLERIYDFKKRRIHYVDHQAKTHAEISLFSDLSFRIAELQSRIVIAAAVQRAGEKGPDNLYTLESLFGLEGEKPPVRLEEQKSEGDLIVLRDQGEILAQIQPGKDTPAPDSALFEKFLIYDHSLHPLIRRRVLAEKRIPKEFRYRLQSLISKDEFVVQLKSFETRDDRGFEIPASYTQSSKRPGALSESAALDGVIQSVKGQDNKLSKAWFWEEAKAAASKKDYLNAVVYYLEYGLQSGDQAEASAEMQKVAAHQSEDAELDRFLRSLGISGKEQASRAIEELQKLDRSKIERGHVIDLMIANQKAVLGENEAAAKILIGALKANPYLAGAYKDLGDLFYGQMDMASAWRCWDFARELEPKHFMVKPISDYEKELVKNYPEFF